ncbi:SpoIID/LytB domain-containing protein [Halonatronum saccharophilum]|uniref:SpoIID/LytB domain-containing protein n=1 Tax=Halonatronum saccharophilum TaxID=150060 RepID=UPI0004892E44|nr:SpoIID/LytB domain-containing protein [Halonatronum saccharophilum]
MLKKLKIITMILIIASIIVGCQAVEEEFETKMGDEPNINIRFEDESVESIALEEYVAGVVAGEMKPAWPTNAYAAQAIKARTFTMKHMEGVDDNTISARHEEAQAYKPENITDVIREAVEMTRGQVAVYDGTYINAWFHSSAAGRTTSAQAGLAFKEGEPPYVKSVESPDDLAPEDIQNWDIEISKAQVLEALRETGEEGDEILELNILEQDDTGRITQIEIVHNRGSKQLHGAEFRTVIGPDNLKSTMVETIEDRGESFGFIGSGWGHGVGMSQWGAKKLAQEGESPEDIIKYYFEGVEIEKRWN